MSQRIRTLMSWSTGKDSALALDMLLDDPSVEVCGLVTSVNATHGRVAMHAVRRDLLAQQAAALGLPLYEVALPHPCSNEVYEAAFATALAVQRDAGVEALAFGDLFLEDVRAYRERQCAALGLTPLFPLWGRDTHEAARSMIARGIHAVLTTVDPRQCPREFIGRSFDAALLAELPPTVDPCGERGEFHTFVHGSPRFQASLPIVLGPVVERDGFLFVDVQASKR